MSSKILIFIIVILAGAGLIWSVASFINGSDNSSESIANLEKNEENFAQAVQSELSDKCQTPSGYTDQGWQEHMSHHPDRYQECFDTPSQPDITGYHNITPNDLADMLEHKDFTLIDVHTPEQNHIPGTDLLIPFDQVAQSQADLPQDKNAKLVIYCRSGSMSQRAAEELNQLGYSNIYNLSGGIKEWQKQGYGVENKLFQSGL